jgi:hypothetical protein
MLVDYAQKRQNKSKKASDTLSGMTFVMTDIDNRQIPFQSYDFSHSHPHQTKCHNSGSTSDQ